MIRYLSIILKSESKSHFIICIICSASTIMFHTRFQKMLMCNVYFWNQSVFIESAGNGIIIKSFNHQFNAIYIYNGWINSVQKDYFQNSTQSSYEYIHTRETNLQFVRVQRALDLIGWTMTMYLKKNTKLYIKYCEAEHFQLSLELVPCPARGDLVHVRPDLGGTSVQHWDTDRGDKYNQGQSFSSSRQNYQQGRGAIGCSTLMCGKFD